MFDLAFSEHRDEILELWIEDIIEAYPEETAKFLRSKADRFANPVGASLREGLAELLDGLLNGTEPTDLTSALDRVIRVRAVQEFSPSAAVGFIFDVRELFRKVAEERGVESSLETLDHRVERLGLCAFDVYMRCREEMWSIRAREIRNQSVGIMERVAEWRDRRDGKSENGRT
jgi:hypothetical protein